MICVDRTSMSREVYSYEQIQRNKLYFINASVMKQGSLHEMREINLQHDLDIIHTYFIHNSVS